jgi:hypothetical protein
MRVLYTNAMKEYLDELESILYEKGYYCVFDFYYLRFLSNSIKNIYFAEQIKKYKKS